MTAPCDFCSVRRVHEIDQSTRAFDLMLPASLERRREHSEMHDAMLASSVHELKSFTSQLELNFDSNEMKITSHVFIDKFP